MSTTQSRTCYYLLAAFLVLCFVFFGAMQGVELAEDSAPKYSYEEERAKLEKEAEQGDASAQLALGMLYQLSDEQDLEKAIYYYELAAEQGQLNAQSILGSLYYNGLVIKQDYKKARYYYELAAKQGDDVVQTMLDTMNLLDQGL